MRLKKEEYKNGAMYCPKCNAYFVEGDATFLSKQGNPCCWDCYKVDDKLVELKKC